MSTGQMEMNPNWAQPEKRRRGCGLKSCLLIGCGGVLLLCCGVGVWGVYFFASLVSLDPAEIAAARAQIAEIDVPDGLRPTIRVDMKFPIVGEMGRGVGFIDESSGSILVLSTVDGRFAESEADLNQALQKALRQGDVEREEDFQVSETSEKELTVRGEEVTFFFAKGKSARTGKELIHVRGGFEGKSGPVSIQFLGDAEKYDEETVTEMIESIK